MAESWLVLVLGVVFACLLAGTQTQLSAKIQANQAKSLENAIAEVVPGFDEKLQLDIDGNRVFKCVDGSGQVVGWAVDVTGAGFIDKIRLVVGLSPDGVKITGLKVIEDLETPGLGNKIEGEWADQYKTLDATRPIVRVKGERHAADNEISAITGATYSSDYVTDIVNDVTRRIGPKLAEQQ